MAFVHGTRPNPGNVIGGTFLPPLPPVAAAVSCWLRGGDIDIAQCAHTPKFTTYTRKSSLSSGDGVTWQEHKSANCYVGHGASWAPTALHDKKNYTVASCKAACEAEPKCNAITVSSSSGQAHGPKRGQNFMKTPYTHGSDYQLR